MDGLNIILSAVSSVGFPIFACLMIFKQNDELTKKLTELIENNTKSNTELTTLVKSLLEREN